MAGRAVPIARRMLFSDRRRAVLAVGGIASGLLLVLLLSGIFSGFRAQASEYIDRSPAQLFVSQEGVRTMHMSISALPPGTAERIAATPGVAWAEPLRYTGALINAGDTKIMTYVIGYEPGMRTTGPTTIVRGAPPGPGEVAVDESAASVLDVDTGSTVGLLGTTLRVSAITHGGAMAMNTTVFLSSAEFVRLSSPTVSFYLVGAVPDVAVEELALQLAVAAPGTMVQTKAEFALQEAEVIDDTFTDMTRVMVGIGFVVAMALIGLTLTTITLSNTRTYGVIKALGGTTRTVVNVVITQALWAVTTATVVAIVTATVLANFISSHAQSLQIVLEPHTIARTTVYALVVALPAAALPIRRVLRIEPAEVFRARN